MCVYFIAGVILFSLEIVIDHRVDYTYVFIEEKMRR